MSVTALRRYRKNRSLTQAQLARLLDCEQATVSNYELGVTRPVSKRIKRDLEAAFGVPLSVLLTAEPGTTNGEPKPAVRP